jgi:hypothetical protein
MRQRTGPALLAIGWLFALPASASEVEVPLNIGVGPAAYIVSGPVYEDQPVHYGLKINPAVILDRNALDRARERIPRRFRSALSQADEIQIRFLYLPESFFISPRIDNTVMYGATWRPIGFAYSFSRVPRLSVSAGMLLTYAYIASDRIRSPTHFLRPGVELKAELTIPFSKRFLLSLGWASGFYIPQRVGGSVLSVAPLNRSVWHIGQGFVLLNVRIPHSTTL